MCWIILNWDAPEVVTIVSNYVGMARLFDTKEEAEAYARENLNFNWKVVELEE
jgi:hypothetical protein